MGALLPLFLTALPELFKLGRDSIVIANYVKQTRTTFQDHDEWTDEAEAKFSAELQELKKNPPPHWQID